MKTDRNTLQEAAYQYLLDHTINTPKGVAVNMLLPKKKDFFRKLRSREKGYNRIKEQTVKKSFKVYERNKKQAEEYSRRLNKFRTTGGLRVRLAFWLQAKCKSYILKRLNEKKKKKK